MITVNLISPYYIQINYLCSKTKLMVQIRYNLNSLVANQNIILITVMSDSFVIISGKIDPFKNHLLDLRIITMHLIS